MSRFRGNGKYTSFSETVGSRTYCLSHVISETLKCVDGKKWKCALSTSTVSIFIRFINCLFVVQSIKYMYVVTSYQTTQTTRKSKYQQKKIVKCDRLFYCLYGPLVKLWLYPFSLRVYFRHLVKKFKLLSQNKKTSYIKADVYLLMHLLMLILYFNRDMYFGSIEAVLVLIST